MHLPIRPWPRRRRWTLVEDPDGLGYRLVSDRLLDVMDADDWYALERAALLGSARGNGEAGAARG
jgi:hypothetical protein